MNLTPAKEDVLLAAYKNHGTLHLGVGRTQHRKATITALVKAGLLSPGPDNGSWCLTETGREALKTVY